MTDSSQPPPGFQSGFVAPPPVYGVEQADGTIAQARTVAEGAAAARARVAANAGLQGAAGWRRLGAGVIDLAFGIAVGAGLHASSPMPVAALVGVALGATFVIRIVVATAADGASLGRLVTATRAVEQDGSRLTLDRVAARECFVLIYVVAFPWWFGLLAERVVASWFLGADGGSIRTAPVPQDRSSGTTVATVAEVRRVRARSTRAVPIAPSRSAAAGVPAPASPHARPAWASAPSAPFAATDTSASPASGPGLGTPPRADAPPPATAGNLPRLAAAPFIPAEPDPDVAAARAALRHGGSTGGMAVHTMEAPEMARRVIAATIDYALIVSFTGLLVSATALSTTALIPALGDSADPKAANAIPVTLFLWLLLRPFAITAFTQTLGQWLMHYRVYAPRGERVGLGKALLREASGWGILLIWAWALGRDGYATPTHIANADLLEGDSVQQRLSHDRFADTWPVRI